MTTFEKELQDALGDAVTFDPQILSSYDHDLGEMPGPLMMLIKHVPQVVVAARNVSDVCKALTIAEKHKIAVTPRAQATSGYGGTIPCKGGMVLDVSGLNRVLAVDPDGVVDVEPGVIWEELSRVLNKVKLDNRVCPTSAPSSTVGGWFAMGGVGIGSLCYGSILNSILAIDVVGLDGKVTTYTGSKIEPFYQTCGTLGVVTRLRLACRDAVVLQPAAVWLPDATKVAEFLSQIPKRIALYSASVQSDGYCSMRASAEGNKPIIDSGFLVSLAIPKVEFDQSELAAVTRASGGRVLDEEIAAREWDERYYPMRIKRIGPSVLVGEYYIPLEEFAACFESIRSAISKDIVGLEGFAIRGGRMAVLIYVLDNSGSLFYPLRMAKAMLPLQIATRHGGSMYASGMWFAAACQKLLGNDKHKEVSRLKKSVDPRHLLNPGKSSGPRFPFLPFLNLSRLILIGTALMAPISARLPYKRPKAS